jgi:exosome complex RNA-binding protein Rrp4
MIEKLGQFKLGNRVMFTNHKTLYVIGHSNPLKGTDYECQGSIFCILNGKIYVKWDNKTTNSYAPEDLTRIDCGHPLTKIFQ